MTNPSATAGSILSRNKTAGAIRILLRMPNWLGDCIMALPALRLLRESLPEATLIVACRSSVFDLMAAQPSVDRVVKVPGSGVGNLVTTLFKGDPELKRGDLAGVIDLGILFTNSLSTALWMWRTGAKIRLGYNLDARKIFLTHPVRCDKRIHALHFVDYYIELVKRALSLIDARQSRSLMRKVVLINETFLLPRMFIGSEGKNGAATLLKETLLLPSSTTNQNGNTAASGNHSNTGDTRKHPRYAVIAPASAYGPVKDWPPEYYRELVQLIIHRYNLPVIVTGGSKQIEICERIASGLDKAVNVAGKTKLSSFLGLVAGTSLFVGGDSGGAHVAAACAVPTLVIFGITNPARTMPSGVNVAMLGRGRREAIKLSTPEAKASAEAALRSISVAEAAAAIERLLKE